MDLETHAIVARLRGIYAIVNEGSPDPVDLSRAILAGGVRIVQYRAKSGIAADSLHALRNLTCDAGALLIVNDDWRAAIAFDADGVHVGPDDARPEDLRGIREAIGTRILGISCGTPEEAAAAQRIGADYIGAGCVFPTQSKADAGDPIGVAGLTAIVRSTPLPVAAIGGITRSHLAQVRTAGAAMAAVISALAQPDPERAARDLVGEWSA